MAQTGGLLALSQFNLDVLSRFRATWKDGPRTASKKLEQLRAFFRFAHHRHWVEFTLSVNIALALLMGAVVLVDFSWFALRWLYVYRANWVCGNSMYGA